MHVRYSRGAFKYALAARLLFPLRGGRLVYAEPANSIKINPMLSF